jgi:hypothetical protein
MLVSIAALNHRRCFTIVSSKFDKINLLAHVSSYENICKQRAILAMANTALPAAVAQSLHIWRFKPIVQIDGTWR